MQEQSNRKCRTLHVSGLKEREDGVGHVNVGGDRLGGDAGHAEEPDTLLVSIIGHQWERVDTCVDLLRLFGCEDDPDGDRSSGQPKLFGKRLGDERHVAAVIVEQGGLLATYLHLLQVEENRSISTGVLTMLTRVDNRSDGERVDVGMLDSTEISVVMSSALGSISLGGSTRGSLGLALTLLMHPGETLGAILPLSQIVGLGVLVHSPPLWTIREPGAGIWLIVELKSVEIIAETTPTVFLLPPFECF